MQQCKSNDGVWLQSMKNKIRNQQKTCPFIMRHVRGIKWPQLYVSSHLGIWRSKLFAFVIDLIFVLFLFELLSQFAE